MSHTAHNPLSHRQKGVKQDLDDQRPAESGEYRCPDCHRQVTKGLSGIEYGHARGRNASAGTERCPRRPDCVDPDKPGSWGVPR